LERCAQGAQNLLEEAFLDHFRAVDRFIAKENISLFEAELLKQFAPAKRESIEALWGKERAKLAAINPRQNAGKRCFFLKG
jgi:hypothetical protein